MRVHRTVGTKLKKSFNLLVVSNTTPFFAVVQIIYFHDCLRIYSFIFLTPWQGLENWSFRILAEKTVVLPYSRTFTNIFVFFPLKIQVLECWQYRKLEKIWFYTKNVKKTQNFYCHIKVLVLEIELKILDIRTTLPSEIHKKLFDNHGNKLLDKLQNLRESSIS